jgi:hypothetical protein
MKRLARILLNVATALSLLLCVATVALWVRTHYVLDDWQRFGGGTGLFILTPRGELALMWGPLHQRHTSAPVGWTYQKHGSPADWGGDRRGEQLVFRVPGLEVWELRQPEAREVVLRLWLVVSFFALLPLIYVARKRRRVPQGICPSCGYDLRATPECCPECGTVP